MVKYFTPALLKRIVENKELIHAALEQAPQGIIITSALDNTVIFINPAMEEVLGVSRKNFVGNTFTQGFFKKGGKIFYPEKKPYSTLDPPRQKELGSKCYRLLARNILAAIHQPGGKKLWALMNTASVLDHRHKTIAMISIVHDVTARIVGTHTGITQNREVEAALYHSKEVLQAELETQTLDLKKTNQKLETVLDSSSESIWVIEGDGTVSRINRKSETLLNIRAEEVVGKHYEALISSGVVDVSVTRKAFQTGRPVTMMQKALRTGRSLLVTSTPVFDGDGKISMVIVNERDLTQLNQLQQELEQVRGESKRIKEAMTALNLKELREQEIIAESKEMQDVLVTALKLSRINVSTILILGESGTGKGLLAKFIHSNSPNKNGPFIQINCAALPETLLEAELFGYEKGAFTGARDQGKIGLFEMAQGGTLFLDELGELSQTVQAKLLKCIEDKEVLHLGGLTPIGIDCTVIAATNIDLVDQVNQKKFRQDLFFRLNTFTLTLPSLRKRPEDILELSMFFLEKYNKEYGMHRKISHKGLATLQSYPFPGNIRELKNAIKKSVVMSETNVMDTILDDSISAMVPRGVARDYPLDLENNQNSFDAMVTEFEKKILLQSMKRCKTTRAIASHLKMTQSQVMRKLKKHGLSQTLKDKKRIR